MHLRNAASLSNKVEPSQMTDPARRLDRMAFFLEQKPHLLRLGRLFSDTVLIQIDSEEFYLFFEKGHITNIQKGPSKNIPWRFALRTEASAMNEFWTKIPKPGFHDIFGLVKYGKANIDGDILALVKNLRYFKEFLALGKESSGLRQVLSSPSLDITSTLTSADYRTVCFMRKRAKENPLFVFIRPERIVGNGALS